MTPARSNVIIIGGGIIGAACAYELARSGAQVTLVDKGEMGHGCSYGNAGWVTPCFALPLPMPGMWIKSVLWLLDRDSPLYIKPRASWELIRWLTRFACSMNERQVRRSAAALIALVKYTLEAYKQLDAEHPGTFGFTQKGLLIVAQTPGGLDAGCQEMKLVADYGIRGRQLDAQQVREIEPAITNGSTIGGVYFPDEAHAEPLATVRALIEGAIRHGATILPGTEVFDFEVSGKRIEAIRTTRGVLRADQFVLATGSWSARLARFLGLRLEHPLDAARTVMTSASIQKVHALLEGPVNSIPTDGIVNILETGIAGGGNVSLLTGTRFVLIHGPPARFLAP